MADVIASHEPDGEVAPEKLTGQLLQIISYHRHRREQLCRQLVTSLVILTRLITEQ